MNVNFKIYLFLIFSLSSFSMFGQQTAGELLDKSIAFHDPQGNWNDFKDTLNFRVEWPNKADSYRKIFIDNENKAFHFWATYEDGELAYRVNENKGFAKWNDKAYISEKVVEKYKISADRAVMYRNYYTYLYGMPMKLKDPGTIIHPEVERVEFYGKTYDRFKVTYEPEVGKDTWYFYFNTETHAMEAYQFFKDESKNNGEYILFEKLKEIDQVKMPRIRKWYYNKDNKYLAADILEK